MRWAGRRSSKEEEEQEKLRVGDGEDDEGRSGEVEGAAAASRCRW